MRSLVHNNINSLPTGLFCMLFCPLLIFFKINFFEKFFWEHYQSFKSLDPDQARHSVWPDLVPNCLQRLSSSADDTSM